LLVFGTAYTFASFVTAIARRPTSSLRLRDGSARQWLHGAALAEEYFHGVRVVAWMLERAFA
jgi:hypothetical protein